MNFGVDYDLQIFNGAVFTNWGYGVAVLQIPFHYVAQIFGQSFFSDRAIVIIYVGIFSIGSFYTFNNYFERRYNLQSSIQGKLVALVITFVILVWGFLWLVVDRFQVYEETIVYLVICQLSIFLIYVQSQKKISRSLILSAGLLAGLGVLIRGTGLVYILVWGIAFLFLDDNSKITINSLLKRSFYYCIGLIPGVSFWLSTNIVKSGSPLSLGYENSTPSLSGQLLNQRFGSTCVESITGYLDTIKEIFFALFLDRIENSPLESCNFAVEGPTPFIGPIVGMIILVLLGFLCLKRNYVGAGLPLFGITLLFGLLVYAGVGITYRYVADFSPVLALLFFNGASTLNLQKKAFIFLAVAVGVICCWHFIYAFHSKIDKTGMVASGWDKNLAAAQMVRNYGKKTDKVIPNSMRCSFIDGIEYTSNLHQHLQRGWGNNCHLQSGFNLILGLPQSDTNNYMLTFDISRAKELVEVRQKVIPEKSKQDRVSCAPLGLRADGKKDFQFDLVFSTPDNISSWRIVKIELVRSYPWGINRTSDKNFILGVAKNSKDELLNLSNGSVVIPLSQGESKLTAFSCMDGYDIEESSYEIRYLFEQIDTKNIDNSVLNTLVNPTVYINGKYELGEWSKNQYHVPFVLNYEKMISPNIMVSVDWRSAIKDVGDLSLLEITLKSQ